LSALDDAILEVSRKARVDEFPALTADEVEQIVTARRLASEWEAETEYAYGAKVLPTTRDGKVRRAIQGGTSGETEPVWGTAEYSQTADGTVIWEEAGMDTGLYDIRGAVEECLTQRALRAAQSGDKSAQAVSQALFNAARRYAPVGVA
jgi:hypothetical protein